MTKFLTDREVAEVTGRSLAALRKDRMKGRGINYHKMGRQVKYSAKDVEAFMESCRVLVKPLSMTEA